MLWNEDSSQNCAETIEQLATEDALSTEVDDDEEEGETTLYFDAEEGTFRTESGAQVEFTMTSESSQPSEEPESGENAEEDRSPTPQPAARPTVHHSMYHPSKPGLCIINMPHTRSRVTPAS